MFDLQRLLTDERIHTQFPTPTFVQERASAHSSIFISAALIYMLTAATADVLKTKPSELALLPVTIFLFKRVFSGHLEKAMTKSSLLQTDYHGLSRS